MIKIQRGVQWSPAISNIRRASFVVRISNKMHFIWVSMYLTLKQYLRTLFLRLLLKTGTPFYMVIRATRRSSRFQGKGCKFISRWLQSCRWLLMLLLLLSLCWCPVVLFCFFFVESITMILNFLPPGLHCTQKIIFLGGGRPQKKLEGFVWGFLSITGLLSQRQFAPKCSFLASRPLGHCSFRISGQIS